MTTRCPRTGIPSQFCSCSLHPAVGGKLDANAYAVLAQRHRPVDQAGLAAAARDLAAQGLTARDISQALQVAEDVVTALLGNAPAQPADAAELHRQAWTGQRGGS